MNTSFRHGSLFSGIGGFDLAAEWMGWENVFHCEWNDFGKKLLNHYWPNSISYHDITKTDFSIHRGTIDILTGGFPCQPYSSAGKRLGKEDERHLWPEMLRAIREIQPRWIVGENVLGLVNWNGGMVFEEVQADLEAEGYEVQPYVLPAAAVNAPHRRDRVWFVAYAKSIDAIRTRYGGRDSEKSQKGIGSRVFDELGDDGKIQFTADTTSKRREKRKQNSGRENTTENRTKMDFWSERFCEHGDAADTGKVRLSSQKPIGELGREQRFTISNEPNTWEKFPTVSPICSRNDGIPDRLDSITFSKWRNESIKAGGNAIVPQVVFQIFKAIHIFETQNLKP